MIKLTLTEKNGEPRLLTFDKDEITIGRVSGNDIVLAKGNVSKRHSRFTVKSPGQIEVADLKSTNGTYVNGRKIGSPMLLSASDRVYVGDFLINIDFGVGAAQSDFSADFQGDLRTPPAVAARGTGCRFRRRLPRRAVGSGRAPRNFPPTTTTARGTWGSVGRGRGRARPGGAPARFWARADPPAPSAAPTTDAAGQPRPRRERLRRRARVRRAVRGRRARRGHRERGAVRQFAESGRREQPAPHRGPRPGAPVAPASAAPSFGSASAAPAITTDVGAHATGFEALLGDAAVTQILITAPDAALVDRGSGLALHDGSLGDPNAVADALWRLANTAFPPPAPDNPVVDVRLADGTRVSAAFPPASPTGVVAAIRRPVLLARTLSDLIPGGSKDAQTLLESAMTARRNLLLTGDAAAMPQLLGALAAAIPADRRVVAIGAAQPQARGGWTDLAPAADMAGLLRVASTLRADHLMVGEVMGPELGELLLVASRGQEGLIAALPGRSSHRDARAAGGAGGRGARGDRARSPRRFAPARSTSCCMSWR